MEDRVRVSITLTRNEFQRLAYLARVDHGVTITRFIRDNCILVLETRMPGGSRLQESWLATNEIDRYAANNPLSGVAALASARRLIEEGDAYANDDIPF